MSRARVNPSNPMKCIQRSVALVSMTICWLPVAANAQTQSYWTNPAGGNYSDGSNWSLGSAGQFPTFNLGSPGYTVTTQAGNGAQQFIVENDNVTLNLNGNTYTNGALYVAPGTGQAGSLTVLGPGTIVQPPEQAVVSVGSSDGSSTGSLTVNGATIEQQDLGSSVFVQNLTVENGGVLQQDHQIDDDSLIVGNLTENNGEISTGSTYVDLLGNTTLQNGSSLETGLEATISIYNYVSLNDSRIESGEDIDFASGASLALADGGLLESGGSLTLPNSTSLDSASNIVAFENISFGGALTIELGPETKLPYGGAFIDGFGGQCDLAGSLDFTLENGFTPTLGEEFDVFKFLDGHEGSFSEIETPALPGGLSWDLSDLYTTGTITVVPEPTCVGFLVLGSGTLLFRRRHPQT